MTPALDRGIHVPPCADLTDHIQNALREGLVRGDPERLDSFVTRVRADWQDEQLMADQGDPAVIEYRREGNGSGCILGALLGIAFYGVGFGLLVPLVGWPVSAALIFGCVALAVVLALRGEAA